MKDKKILLVIEGPEGEGRILGSKTNGLLSLIGEKSEIISFETAEYNTSIYELYDDYVDGKYDDLVSFLRNEKGLKIPDGILSKKAFNEVYLIFDFDPQYHKYDDLKIHRMLDLFCDETDLGKLYINYPMVESFYHLKSLPDPDYYSRTVSVDDISSKKYKKTVRAETAIIKHKMNTRVYSMIVMHNYNKAKILSKAETDLINYTEILNKQITMKNEYKEIFVLNTLALLPIDYNFEHTINILKLRLKGEFLEIQDII